MIEQFSSHDVFNESNKNINKMQDNMFVQDIGKSLRQGDSNNNWISNSTDINYVSDLRQPPFMILVYSLAYGVIFVFALFGNVIVIAIVTKTRRLHTVTNFFFVNLAIADLLVAVFCIPSTLIENIFNGWRLGALMCKATPYMQGISVFTSVNLLVAIAVDRFLAICFTLEHKMTWRIGKCIVGSIWFLAFSIMLPWMFSYDTKLYDAGERMFFLCELEWSSKTWETAFLLIVFLICYVIPLLVIILCYSLIALRVSTRNAPGISRYNTVIQKSKVKVIKMLALIVFLFGVSWLPLYTFFLMISFNHLDSESSQFDVIFNVCIPFAQWLGLSNSAMNPIIYCFFSKPARKRLSSLVSCTRMFEFPRQRNHVTSSRFISGDYCNGHMLMRLKNRRWKTANFLNASSGNKLCESTFYD